MKFEGDEAFYEDARTLEEQSNDIYFQAVTDRTQAKMMPDGYEKIQKLRQAMEYEDLAIDKQLTVLGLYYGIDLTDKGTSKEMPVETLQPAAMEITGTEPNSGQIQTPVIQTTESQPVEQKEPDGIQPPVATLQAPVEEPQVAAADKEKEIQISESPEADIRSVPETQQQQAEQPIAVVEKESQPSQMQTDVVYRIQVAASRTLLTKEKVANLCSNSYTMGVTVENGWYKYHIVAGNSYEQAKKILRECGVEKAFIVPFKNGNRITIAEASQTNP